MNAHSDTRAKLLDFAQDLLQRQSISGVSFQELARRAGIKKGSLFYHFESKDALIIAVLERAEAQLLEFLTKASHKPAEIQLNKYIDIYGKYFGAGEKLCPGGVFAAEWGSLSPAVQQQVQHLLQVHLRELTRIIELGRREGAWRDLHAQAGDLATWIAATLQGGLVLARVMDDPAAFDRAVKVMLGQLLHS